MNAKVVGLTTNYTIVTNKHDKKVYILDIVDTDEMGDVIDFEKDDTRCEMSLKEFEEIKKVETTATKKTKPVKDVPLTETEIRQEAINDLFNAHYIKSIDDFYDAKDEFLKDLNEVFYRLGDSCGNLVYKCNKKTKFYDR
jgi:hypothetical protein